MGWGEIRRPGSRRTSRVDSACGERFTLSDPPSDRAAEDRALLEERIRRTIISKGITLCGRAFDLSNPSSVDEAVQWAADFVEDVTG